MLVEHGFVRAQLPDGREWTFTPSLGRMESLGQSERDDAAVGFDPTIPVRIYAELHGPQALKAARVVLRHLWDGGEDHIDGALGFFAPGPLRPLQSVFGGDPPAWIDGGIPDDEQIIIARHLMQHGICGRPEGEAGQEGGGRYSESFKAGEFITLARSSLEMSAADAAALSMTELQQLMAVKFPPQEGAAKGKNVPTRAEYEAAMKRLKERRGE